MNIALYTKDPNTSLLGKQILSKTVDMIYEIGFEKFTFKKLAISISSNESSIYRYFKNKHDLLIYLSNFHWQHLEYKVNTEIDILNCSVQRLYTALRVYTSITPLTKDKGLPTDSTEINLGKLHQIVINEGTKVYHTKLVDKENQNGFFKPYKVIVQLLSSLIKDACSEYLYPDTLASMIVEGVSQQYYYSSHLPTLTNCSTTMERSHYDPSNLYCFYRDLISKVLHLHIPS